MFNNGYSAAMSGRSKSYCETEVLDATMHTFWVQGFSATNYDDLVSATGLGRQSLYHAFGDKSSLFQKSLRHYAQNVTQQSLDVLASDRSPIENIRRWLNRLRIQSLKHRNGCLLTNTAVELAPHNSELAKVVASDLKRIEKALELSLDRAIEEGELPKSINAASIAIYLLGVAQGVMVLGRSGASRAKLKTLTDLALSTIELQISDTNQ